MKIIRAISIILLILITVTGVCGCMKNQNEEVKVGNMKSYASNKYGREFTVENFQAAKDETYTNILTLSDGDYLFNVYQSGTSEVSDDYPLAIINRKFSNLLNSGKDFDVYTNFMFANGSDITLDYAKNRSIDTITDDYSLLKVVVIIVVEQSISDCADDLFELYKKVMAFNPKYIDLEVIQTNSISSGLNDMLKNLPAFYDNDWNKHSEIVSYLSVTETDIDSSKELVKGVK